MDTRIERIISRLEPREERILRDLPASGIVPDGVKLSPNDKVRLKNLGLVKDGHDTQRQPCLKLTALGDDVHEALLAVDRG